MASSTPLRYPGGKTRLRPYVQALLQQNNLYGAHYAEPFCGGAGLAIELLLTSSVEHVHLNDLDRAIFAFWDSVLNHTDELCAKIQNTPCNIETWLEQRELWLRKSEVDLLSLGFATFFMNRTNRSGILAAGVIGGKSQAGQWKIDARYNRNDLVSRIQKIASRKANISLHNLEAKNFLTQLVFSLPKRSLIYLDPPYVQKGPGLYLNHYNEDDHRSLAQCVTSLKLPWMVSYDDHPLIRECYGNRMDVRMSLPYSAYGNARRGAEIFYFSHKLTPPCTEGIKSRYRQPWA